MPRTVTPHTPGTFSRPKVLLADDHKPVLEIVAGLLAADFDVVAAVSDGRTALDLSLRLDPDVVVLDVTMPELDGFETLQELRRRGSRAKVVLLTMHLTDAYVAAAIKSGAHGYVLKTRIHSDLTGAIDHALAGRLFVPSLTSFLALGGGGHVAQFYMNGRFFLDEVSQFFVSTLRSGEPIVVIGTEQTRTGITGRLNARGMDLAALTASGQYVVMDAAESLTQFMRNGWPDAGCVAEMAGDLNRQRVSSARGSQTKLTVFGEMSAVLCQEGNVEAAAELERTWNDLTRLLPFLTVCSYPIECFESEESHRLFRSICSAHCAVNHAFNA